jgi:hypothetical protein
VHCGLDLVDADRLERPLQAKPAIEPFAERRVGRQMRRLRAFGADLRGEVLAEDRHSRARRVGAGQHVGIGRRIRPCEAGEAQRRIDLAAAVQEIGRLFQELDGEAGAAARAA